MMVGHAVTLNIDRPRYDAPVAAPDAEGHHLLRRRGRKAAGQRLLHRLWAARFWASPASPAPASGSCWRPSRACTPWTDGIDPVHCRRASPPHELVGKTPMQIKKAGVAMAFVPEDRLGMGLVGSMGMTDNMMLRSWRKGKGIFVNRKDPNELADAGLEGAGGGHPQHRLPRAPDVRRQRAEGAGRP